MAKPTIRAAILALLTATRAGLTAAEIAAAFGCQRRAVTNACHHYAVIDGIECVRDPAHPVPGWVWRLIKSKGGTVWK